MISPNPLLRLLIPLFLLAALNFPGHGAEQPFFKPGDVIAFVGGEDMVAAAEHGYIETLITSALPDYKLKFRCLAWEGDTVFEQRRDLNYPTLEQQLDKIGATVVIAQFGQLESFAGKEKVQEFMAAYEKLIERLSDGGKRRLAVIPPSIFSMNQPTPPPNWPDRNSDLYPYTEAIIAKSNFLQLPNLSDEPTPDYWTIVYGSNLGDEGPFKEQLLQRDKMHLNESGHAALAVSFSRLVGVTVEWAAKTITFAPDTLRTLIQAKNRLWHHYYRPQNWAFLAGDRTNQPSSRDHRDPSKRWFPEELEQFLPLIEQKEAEIHELAASLAKP